MKQRFEALVDLLIMIGKKNQDFGNLLSRIEEETLIEVENNFDTNEVIKILPFFLFETIFCLIQ